MPRKWNCRRPTSTNTSGSWSTTTDRGKFESLETLQQGAGFLIAVPPIEGSVEAVKQLMPLAATRTFASINNVIGDPRRHRDLRSASSAPTTGVGYIRSFASIRPAELTAANTLVYAVPEGEVNLRSLLDLCDRDASCQR